MQFHVHHIQNHFLRPYIQYILFNHCADKFYKKTITSFANTNICLGILKGNRMRERTNGEKYLEKAPSISSYISGIYLKPNPIIANGSQDEICIDFTPLGYYHFFPFESKKFILNDDILTEAFGRSSHYFFEKVFEHDDFCARGSLIESFLLKNIKTAENDFLNTAMYHIHQHKGNITCRELCRELNCSENKLYRNFKIYFDLSPKEYLRVVKFREALGLINKRKYNLSYIASQSNYYDESHLIREFNFFTGRQPVKLSHTLTSIEQKVFVNILQ